MKKLLLFTVICAFCFLFGCNSTHTHSFDQKNLDSKYLKELNCLSGNTYYYSCNCGEAGTETFTTESKKHYYNWQNVCDVCGDSFTKWLKYKLSETKDYYIITDGTETTESTIVIPQSINNIPVKVIGASAFEGKKTLRQIEIPEGIVEIQARAFYGSGLESVTLPNSLIKVGTLAFNSTKLESVILPESLIELGAGAFNSTRMQFNVYENFCYLGTKENPYHFCYGFDYSGSNSLSALWQEGVNFSTHPQTRVVADRVFYTDQLFEWRFSPVQITLNEGLMHIGERAFCGSPIETLHLPSTLRSLGEKTFCGCYNLKAVTVSDNPYFTYVNGCVIENQTKTLIFADKNLNLPNDGSIKHIREYSFAVTDVAKIIIPDSVESIDGYIYLEWMGDNQSVKEIVLGKGVKRVEDGAFNDFKGVNSIKLNEGLTYIGNSAFYTSSLTEVMEIPSTAEVIDFIYYLHDNITVSPNSKYFKIVNGCLIELQTKRLFAARDGFVIPTDGSVEVIDSEAFYFCEFDGPLTIPASVRLIENYTFSLYWDLPEDFNIIFESPCDWVVTIDEWNADRTEKVTKTYTVTAEELSANAVELLTKTYLKGTWVKK